MNRTIGTILGLALLAAGCGSTGQHPQVTPSATITTPPADGGSFTDPRTIVERSQGTLPCGDLAEATPSGALLQVECADGEIIVRTYADHRGVTDQIEFHKLQGGNLLTGQNWTVNADPSILEAAKAKLGGEIVHIPCETAC